MEQTPGWHPDPSGRHQHRFWDGAAWTDAVADDGHEAADPLGDPPSAAPGPSRRRAAGLRLGKQRWPLLAAGGAGAVLVVVVAVALLGGDGSSGTGPTTANVRADVPTTRTVDLRAGEAVGFEVRAERKDVRFRVAIAVDANAARQIEPVFGSSRADAYDSVDYSDFFGSNRDDRRLLYAGRARGFFAESFVAPATGTYSLSVRPDVAARLRLDIETQTRDGLAARYSPVELYRLRRDKGYRDFFQRWDRRSQGDIKAFSNFSDPYSDANSNQSDYGYSDYLSEYSDYVTDSGNSDSSGTSS